MARTISATARAAMYARETDAILCVLLVIDHDDLDAPLRFTNNNEDLTYDGETYYALPFEVSLPPERDDAPPTAQLRMCAIDRTIIQAVRSIESAATVSLSVALVAAVDDVSIEVGPMEMTLTDVTYDAFAVQGKLAFARIFDSGYPASLMTPNSFPGLWGSRPDSTDWPTSGKGATVPPATPRGWPRFGRYVPKRGQEP